jgi:Bacterial regulatory helix-turn-helix protein, lysR family
MSRSRLPPLNAIKAFEAAARLGSFTRAAEELNVTHAHQMVNSSATDPLVYLCVSTMHGVEIVEYPDSGKVGAGVADPTSPAGFRRIGLFRAGSGTLDYWDVAGRPAAANRGEPRWRIPVGDRPVAILWHWERAIRGLIRSM